MSKDRMCPLCGLKMTRLAFQLWQCKCGYNVKGVEEGEEAEEHEHERRHRWRGEQEGRFSKQKHQPHKGLRET